MSAAMPKMMYGTAWKKGRTADLVYQAIKTGFRGVDTACQPKHYREDLVGQGLKRVFDEGICKREDVFIQTKYTPISGQDTSQPIPYNPTDSVTDQVTQSVARSLENLQVSYIDAVILHSPLRTRSLTVEAYQCLEDHHRRGLVKHLGISNIYDPELLRYIIKEAEIKPTVVQNRWYEGNSWDWDIVDLCHAHNIRYQSFWTISGSPSLLAHPVIHKLAAKRGITPEQVVYKLCQLWNITPLSGTTSLEHMQDDVEIQQKDGIDKKLAQTVLEAMRGQ